MVSVVSVNQKLLMVLIMSTINRCCGVSPRHYKNDHNGKFWLECPFCNRFKVSRSRSVTVEMWNFSTPEHYPEHIPLHLNQESSISTLKGTHHV